MPPKCKFTKEEVVAAAVALVSRQGAEALTARGLAEELGASAKPIFGLFSGMDEVRAAVIDAAQQRNSSYLWREIEKGEYPAYKASGMGYIRFAREERELFKLLYMRDRTGEILDEGKEELRPILRLIRENLHISEEEAFRLHLELWIYVHGIATMIATGFLDWDMDFVSAALTDAYQGLKYRYTEESYGGH